MINLVCKRQQVKNGRENCNNIDLSSDNIVVNFRWNECVVAEIAAALLHLLA